MGDVTVPAPQMSPEHMVILRLVATGASNAQIASAMNLSTKAIEYSIRRIAQQLDVPTKGEENPRVLLTRRYFELTGVSRE
jgi:DNA-binding NarL/FixJ family response regulator